MAFTAAQLNQFYTNVNQGAAPDAATQVLFSAYAQQNANGTLTDAQTISLVTNTAQTRATTDVALATYQFFTGSAPTTGATGGLNYLLNNPGTGFNTSYYNGTGTGASATSPGTGGFNLENRYYNQSVNLATNAGTNASFISTYGTLSLNDTVRIGYEQIIGTGSVGSAQANAAIADIQSRIGYFTQVAQQRAGTVDGANTTAGQNIALKAVIIGYILEEAIKADVGTYAKAIDNFNAANAQAATATGINPTTGANLITAYAPGTTGDTLGGTTTGNSGAAGVTIAYQAGQNVSLTSADLAFRSTTNNDTLNATGVAVTAGTTIDLNGGNDNFIAGTIGATGNTTGTSVTLGGGNDTIGTQAAPTVLVQATGNTSGTILIDGGAGTDVGHFATAGVATGGTNASVAITGVETVFIQTTTAAAATIDTTNITGATQLWHEGSATNANNGNVVFNAVASGVTAGVANTAGTVTSTTTFNYVAGGNQSLALTGSNGAVTVAGSLAGGTTTATLSLSHTANTTLAALTYDGTSVTDTGTTEINIGALTISGAGSHTVNLASASRAALVYTTNATATATVTAPTDTITFGGGADVLNLNFGATFNSSVTLGAGADTVFVAATYSEDPAGGPAAGTRAGANVAGTGATTLTFSSITDFAKGVDHVNVELGTAGVYVSTFGNAAFVGAASLAAAANTAATLAGANNSTVFEYSGNTYILQNNATAAFGAGDTLVQLVGLTGSAVNTTAGATSTGDIHFG